MKKTILLIGAVLSAWMLSAQTQDPGNYCVIDYTNTITQEHSPGNYNMIQSVAVNGQTQAIGAEESYGGQLHYQYYNTNPFPTLSGNVDLEISFYSVYDGEPIYFSVWIDYNHNGVFEETERVMENQNTIMAALNTFNQPDQQVTKSIAIPTTAAMGQTRMRVYRGQASHAQSQDIYTYDAGVHLDPCVANDGKYGCYYDFSVNIGVAGLSEFDQLPGAIYPNPASDQLFISGDLQQEVLSYEILTIAGEPVASDVYASGNAITTTELVPGTYLVRLLGNNDESVVTRFTKR